MTAPPVIGVIAKDLTADIPGIVCCGGYELGLWRKVRLAKHLIDWLPDCALTNEEKLTADALKPYRTLELAARRFFKPEQDLPRGEIGELLAHAICAQEFDTRQFVARLYYKMRTNDQVTGFDVVHLRYVDDSDELELWLGEAKIHKDFAQALSSAIKTIMTHLDSGFLEETKALIGPKIEKDDPLANKLSWIFDGNVSLDEVVDRMVIPVLIAANCAVDAKVGSKPRKYLDECRSRLKTMQRRLLEKYGKDIKIVAIYFPLNDKSSLEDEFRKRLAGLT
jgi:hypothetical protein